MRHQHKQRREVSGILPMVECHAVLHSGTKDAWQVQSSRGHDSGKTTSRCTMHEGHLSKADDASHYRA